jgi:hypothetical protein
VLSSVRLTERFLPVFLLEFSIKCRLVDVRGEGHPCGQGCRLFFRAP